MTLPPPPDGMRVELVHDGVRWTCRKRTQIEVLAGVCLVLGVGFLVGWFLIPGFDFLGVGIVPLALAVPLTLQALVSHAVAVTDRAVVVARHVPWGARRTWIRLDDLRSAEVVDPGDGRDAALVLRGPEGAVAVGQGDPVEHLEWMRIAIEAAKEASGRRERTEGREWHFLRKAPEEVVRLGPDR